MYYNHARRSVRAYFSDPIPGEEAFCPECHRQLIARRPELRVWHWAHKAVASTAAKCPWVESPWHLQWKLAHLKLKGWQIEAPIQIGAKRYVLDAYHQGTGRIREFVHSLSPYYVQKHLDLLSAGHKVQWIFDVFVFVSAHAVHV